MSARIRGALVWVLAVSLSCPAIATAATGPLTASQASAQARQTGKAVVVSSLTTSHSTTTANPNGTFTTADSVTGGRPNAWTEIDSAEPRWSGWDQTQPEQVGRGHDGVSRSFYQFDATQLAGVTVLGSQLTVTEVDSAACTVPAGHDGTVNLYLTGTIDQHTNWVNQPRRTSGVIASSNAQFGHDSTCPSAAVTFDVTSAIQSRAAGNTATFGLRADDEHDKYGWKEFDDAVWFTTYDITPVAPSNPRMPPGQCSTTTPYPVNPKTEMDLRVDTSVRSDGVGTPLTVAFTVLDATGATVLSNSFQTGAGSGAQLDIAAGRLPDGTYTWTATASDGTLTSRPSPTCGFRIDTQPPANPVITVNGPADCTTQSCAVPVRTPINLTFSYTGTGEIPASYVYQLGVESPVTVTATNGTWTGNIEPRQVGFTTLSVQSLTTAGTFGATASMTIFATAVPSVDGDFNGDGHPDLLSAGNTDGMAPGLWLSPGDGTGHLGAPSDIGVNGTGISSTGSPSDWNGAIIAHGQFFGTGEQDILAVSPPPGPDSAQNVLVIRGSGDGSPLVSSSLSVCFTTDDFNCFTSAQTITQITAVGNLPADSCAPNCADARPDLFAVVNNQLWWFQNGGPVPGDFQGGVVLDSTIDWSTKQISGTTYAGQPALVVRDKNTGEIDLYANGQGANWFTSATKIVMATTSAAADQIDAVDANSDGQPDLWTVATDGDVTFYPGIGNGQLGTPISAGTL